MKEHPDYKYRPRRKPKALRRDGYPYPMPYPSVPVEALRAGMLIKRRTFPKYKIQNASIIYIMDNCGNFFLKKIFYKKFFRLYLLNDN